MPSLKQLSVLLSRISLFIIYFWFGLLKVLGQSPASHLVQTLMLKTIPFMPFGLFIILFGIFEIIIGIMFIVPGLERWASVLFFLHIIMTALPLFLLPEVWTHIFVPTLEGQYIIKNLALIACVITIYSSISPRKLESNATI